MNKDTLQEMANLITVGTFISNLLFSILYALPFVNLFSVPEGLNISFRFVVFCFLEVCLAKWFGWGLIKVEYKDNHPSRLSLALIAIVSAGVSLFNVQWLLISDNADIYYMDTYKIVVIGVLTAWIVAIGGINQHYHKAEKVPVYRHEHPSSYWIQSVSFFVIVALFLYFP